MISRRIFALFFASSVLFSVAESVESYRYAMELHSYRDAMDLAKEQGRKVYVLFGGDHCPWCQKQKDVLLKEDVIAALSGYVLCYVDVSSDRDIARKYRIRTMPVNMVLDSDESIVKKSVGYMDESTFLGWLR